MTKTRNDLVLRALQELGVVAAGQAGSAEDSQFVDNEVDPMFDNLAQRNVFQWGDPDQIDDNAFTFLAKWLANSTARAFGGAPDENVRMSLEQNLREIKPVFLSGEPQRVDYY